MNKLTKVAEEVKEVVRTAVKIGGIVLVASILVFGGVSNVAAQETTPPATERQVISGTPVERAKQRLIMEVMRRIEAAKTQEGLTEEQAALGMQRAIESFDLEIAVLQRLSAQRRTTITPQDINDVMNNAYRAFTNQIREYGSMNTPERGMRADGLSERDHDINTIE